MSTKADYHITDKLSVRLDVDGHPFGPDDQVCAQLTGVIGGEFDYFESLTIAQALELMYRLQCAVTERSAYIRSEAMK